MTDYHESHFFKVDVPSYTHRQDYYDVRYATQSFLVDLPPYEVRYYRKLYQRLRRSVSGSRICLLDVACGTGRTATALPPDFRYIGTDFSLKAVFIGRELRVGQHSFVAASVMSLPFRSQSFDIITCNGSLEHFPDMYVALKEMKRVLAKNGRIYIESPNLFFVGYYLNYCLRKKSPWSGQELDRLAGYDGFVRLFDACELSIEKYWGRNYRYRGWKPEKHLFWNIGQFLIPNHLRENHCFVLRLRDNGSHKENECQKF